ncbi:NAD-dependent epimerase/dehydratase family protein [Actinacidiphila acididurans]|uniref:NAD-dependent epimerase/dehydratase family protein n=1 Tax=Actinacidiphila acididurans TaxID=2784346 RepID=A0ABS2TPE9_9ACTN|nr:NAD-dependent epimerase/dehydratase family protein [Actinacidiphila acididurans]MBM9505204.1 NAD-dependent epimerase/dehydratase family protein [Actinacidiphila acididurans]
MKLLVLGGTEFVGRAVAQDALRRGWEVTVFHRGVHPAPPGARVLTGDRETGDLKALAEGTWDAVVDTWARAPRAVEDAAAALGKRVGRYAYISSRSVYAYPAPAEADESAPVVEGGDGDYAAVKRGGELAAQAAYGDAALLVRAGLILGPDENIGRLPWWLNRIARGGDVLAPGPADLGIQYMDVRDLAAWTLTALEEGRSGPYNLVSPPGHTTMGEFLRTCVEVTGSDARLRWAAPEVIAAAGIEPWTQLPVWLPPGEEYDFLHRGDVGKALAAGLRCRPVADTIRDTWHWLRTLDGAAPQRPDRPGVGLDPEVEAQVLAGLDD